MGGTVKKCSATEVRGWPGLVECLARVCEEAPIGRKILLVANHHAGQLILQSLARRSGGWLNMRAATPADLAWEAIAAEPGRADFPSAVEWLNSAIEADVEPLSILAGRADLVRVMNLHRAKGLEAPIVILAAPYKAEARSPESHVDRFGGREPSAWFQVTRRSGDYGSKIVGLGAEAVD